MEKTLLIIGQPSSFLAKSIENELTKKSFLCHICDYDVNAISQYMDSVSSFFICSEPRVNMANKIALGAVKEHCYQEGKKVFVMGEPEGVDSIAKLFDESLVWEKYKRPINTKTVCESIFQLFEDDKKKPKKKHILVVDDSGTFLHTIRTWLEPKYTVTMVNSALNGLSFLGKKTPDLILLDYEMPVCSGPQMLEMLRADEQYKDIPVMFLTGKGDRASINKVLTLNPQGYILKSLPQNGIVKMIDDYFEKED